MKSHVFSASVQNEFRFGFLRVSGGQGDPNAGTPFASQYGLQGTTTNPSDMGYPQVSLSNAFTTMGSATGFSSRTDRDFEIYDNVSIQRGAHSIKFGGYFFHLNFNPSYPNDARGIYTYSGAYSGNALADFLLGYPSQAQVGIGEGAENAHTSWAHFYVEDGWKVTRNLMLNALTNKIITGVIGLLTGVGSGELPSPRLGNGIADAAPPTGKEDEVDPPSISDFRERSLSV